MNDERAFFKHILSNPSDLTARLVFADWMEERGDPRSELLRLQHRLTQEIQIPDRPALEARQRDLRKSGLKPIGPFLQVLITSGVEMIFVCIPPGTFLMGSPESEAERAPRENPHPVILTKGFFMSVYPVTQKQWRTVMGNNPSYFSPTGEAASRVQHISPDDLERFPVDLVSWEDAQDFCAKLSEMTHTSIRLPSEAEWEYACRGGTTTPFCFGKSLNGSEANCDGSQPFGTRIQGQFLRRTSRVGAYAAIVAHPWGLCDMHGNVWEWCEDWAGAYRALPTPVDPVQTEQQTYHLRILRGGCWSDKPAYCRAASRGENSPSSRSGFRVCLRWE